MDSISGGRETTQNHMLLRRSKETDSYILWKTNNEELPNNKAGNLPRLRLLFRKIKKNPTLFHQYDEIIRDQLAQEIVERIQNMQPIKKEFHLPHRPVMAKKHKDMDNF